MKNSISKGLSVQNGNSRKIEIYFFQCSVWAKVAIKISEKCINNENCA